MGAEGLGSWHRSPAGWPAGYKAHSRLHLGQLAGNLGLNRYSWEVGGICCTPQGPETLLLTHCGSLSPDTPTPHVNMAAAQPLFFLMRFPATRPVQVPT